MRCEQELAVGAYLLDALEPEEQLRMREHVAVCPVCGQSARELGGVSRLLAGLDIDGTAPPDVAAPDPAPSELAYHRLRSAAAVRPAAPPVDTARSAGRRRWRLLAVAAAAAVVLGGGAAGVVALTGGTPAAPATVSARADGVTAHARITAAGSGSLITLTLDGVPLGERCRLVAVGRDGERSQTREWSISRPGALTWTDTVSVAPGDLDHLEVVTADGRTLLTLPA